MGEHRETGDTREMGGYKGDRGKLSNSTHTCTRDIY